MSVCIVWPEQMPALSNYFGGVWMAVSEPFGDTYSLPKLDRLPFLLRRLESHFASPQVNRRQLQIFRRVGGAEATKNVEEPPRTNSRPNHRAP